LEVRGWRLEGGSRGSGVGGRKKKKLDLKCLQAAPELLILHMIKSFRHKGLSRLFGKNDPSGIRTDLVDRCRSRLMVLHEAENLLDINVPGFDFHALQGKPKRHSVHVNGPWCITFEWVEGDVYRVDLIQYH